MSTSLHVLPGSSRVPTVSEVLRGGEVELQRFVPSRAVRMRATEYPGRRRIAPTAPFWCGPEQYLWVTIDGVAGGTDVYVNGVHDFDEPGKVHWLVDEGYPDAERFLAAGHEWTFRRSAGQPRAVVLVSGLLAGVLARLTRGLVTTTDAREWDGPTATGAEFLVRYFDAGSEGRLWAHRWLDDLDDEFT